MGTDISCYVEKKDAGGWSLAEPLERNPYRSEAYPEEEPKMAPQALFTSRNSALFSILANVRNPVRALEPFNFISKPRGFPDEASPELRAYYDTWQSGGQVTEILPPTIPAACYSLGP